MRSYLLSGACAASMLLAITAGAQAADIDYVPEPAGWGWYVSVFGGWSLPTEEIEAFFETGASITFTSFDAEIDLDNGFMAGAALGIQFNDWLRADVEVSGHWHDADGSAILGTASLVGTPTPALVFYDTTVGLSGEVDATFVLANLWLDVPVGDMMRPYVGGGVGFGRLDVDVDTSGGIAGIDDSDWAFAYQLGAGIGFGFTPNIALDLGYRYKVISNAELDATAASGAGFEVEADYKSHNVLLGVRLGF